MTGLWGTGMGNVECESSIRSKCRYKCINKSLIVPVCIISVESRNMAICCCWPTTPNVVVIDVQRTAGVCANGSWMKWNAWYHAPVNWPLIYDSQISILLMLLSHICPIFVTRNNLLVKVIDFDRNYLLLSSSCSIVPCDYHKSNTGRHILIMPVAFIPNTKLY